MQEKTPQRMSAKSGHCHGAPAAGNRVNKAAKAITRPVTRQAGGGNPSCPEVYSKGAPKSSMEIVQVILSAATLVLLLIHWRDTKKEDKK